MPDHDQNPDMILVDNTTDRARPLSDAMLARMRESIASFGELLTADGPAPVLFAYNHEPLTDEFAGPYNGRYKVQLDRLWQHWRETVERYGYLPRTDIDTDAIGRDYLNLTAPEPTFPSSTRTDWQMTPDGWWRGWTGATDAHRPARPLPVAARIRAGLDRYHDCPS